MRNSVRDGNWSDPTTWDCNCVPGINSLATINDSVTLDVSRTYAYGNITINAGGKLIQDAAGNRNIIFVGGSFVNYGEAEFTNFHISTSNSTLIQDGIMRVRTFTSLIDLYNTGTIEVDSIYLNGQTTNNGVISGLTLLNDSVFLNAERLNVNKVTNRQEFNNTNYFECNTLNNLSLFTNEDTMIVNGDFWNAHQFFNGNINNMAYVEVGNDFLSDNTGDSTFLQNQAYFKVLGNWHNTGDVIGNTSGYFIVSNNSGNTGTMIGFFDFCDLTPPANYPFIDFNSGAIDPNISWCAGLNINDGLKQSELTIYPNPTSNNFTIKGNKQTKFIIQNHLGQVVITGELNQTNNFRIDAGGLPSGVFFLKLENANTWSKISVMK